MVSLELEDSEAVESVEVRTDEAEEEETTVSLDVKEEAEDVVGWPPWVVELPVWSALEVVVEGFVVTIENA